MVNSDPSGSDHRWGKKLQSDSYVDFFKNELGSSAILSDSMDNAQINFKSKRLLRKWEEKML